MTIEEAIQHCNDEAVKLRKDSAKRLQIGARHESHDSEECAAEHEQLAECLTELKQRREAEITAPPKSNGDRIRQMTDEELVREFSDSICNIVENCEKDISCYDCKMQWLKQEVSEDDIQ